MISVCLTTFNGEKYIKKQLDSILLQLSENDEVIISDDGSSDETLSIINNFHDSRIKVLHHKQNNKESNHRKATANFENALQHAQGDYIFLSDQDDVWLPNKVNICISELKQHDFVVHNMKVMNSDEEIIRNSFFSSDVKLPESWFSVVIKLKFYGCCMAFNKKVLDYILPIPYSVIGHDYWIFALAIKSFICSYISEPLIIYREHSDSVSYNKKTSLLYKISYRMALLWNILNKHREK